MYHFMVTLTLVLASDLVNILFFQNMFVLHIKLKRMKYNAAYKIKTNFAQTSTLDL